MITLKNKLLTLTIRPIGAKITSLRFKKKELIYLPTGKEYLTLKPLRGDIFNEKMAWGGDICAPGVAKCETKIGDYVMSCEDHGDFWTTVFVVRKETINSVTLVGESKEFRMEVAFKLQGSTLIRAYRTTNLTKYTLSFTFADHLLMPINNNHTPAEYINLPHIKKMLVEWSYQDKLGKKGSVINWPLKRTRPFADKLFALLKKDKNKGYFVDYQGDDYKIELSSAELNHIGYWHTEEGWNGQYNLGLELSNTNNDSLKEGAKSGSVWIIKPRQSKKWSIRLKITDSI